MGSPDYKVFAGHKKPTDISRQNIHKLLPDLGQCLKLGFLLALNLQTPQNGCCHMFYKSSKMQEYHEGLWHLQQTSERLYLAPRSLCCQVHALSCQKACCWRWTPIRRWVVLWEQAPCFQNSLSLFACKCIVWYDCLPRPVCTPVHFSGQK